MEKVYHAIACIEKAFPKGIEEVYPMLIGYLSSDFTIQNLSTLLGFVAKKDPSVVKQDIKRFQNVEIKQEFIDILQKAGYQKV